MRAALLAIVGLSAALAVEARGNTYQVTDLGTLGGLSSVGRAINADGKIAGEFTNAAGVGRAFLYDGTMHDIGTLGGTFASAFGINRFGHVTGQAARAMTASYAFAYDGVMHDLGSLDGINGSFGRGINASDVVTGDGSFDGHPRGFVYSEGVMRPLGTLGGDASHAHAINDAGQIVGDAYLPGNLQRAALWDGTWHDLGTLGVQSVALGISANGLVTGESVTSSGALHAFLYDGTMHDLGTVAGDRSEGSGVNSSGVVTGWSQFTPGSSALHAFLYTQSGGMIDLNSLIDPRSGWELTGGYAINDTGQITGSGRIGGQSHAFLLTPVPEPSAWLALAGAAAFLSIRSGAGKRNINLCGRATYSILRAPNAPLIPTVRRTSHHR